MLEPAIIHDAYFLLIPLAILEGPVLALLCGVGAGLGYINPFVAWGILVFGDLFTDFMYYGIGRWGATLPWVRRAATRTRLIRENLPPLETLWRERPFLALASAKLAYGVSPPLIVSAGISGLSLRRFAACSITASILYFGILDWIGYGFSSTFGSASRLVGNAPLYIGILGVFCIFLFGFGAYWARKRLPKRQARQKSNIIES